MISLLVFATTLAATYGAACPAASVTLACGLLAQHNAGVLHLATRHPGGVSDNATAAYNNIKDVCNGNNAAVSHHNCTECPSIGAAGGSVCLSHNLLNYLTKVVTKGPVTVNELSGACYSCNSKHYLGLAVDLRNDARSEEYIATCISMGGWGQHEGNFIHCQFTS